MNFALLMLATSILVVNAVTSSPILLPVSGAQVTSTTPENTLPECKSICGLRGKGLQAGSTVLPPPPIALDSYRNGSESCGSRFSEWQAAAYNFTRNLDFDDGIYSSWCQYNNPNEDIDSQPLHFASEPSEMVTLVENKMNLRRRPSQNLTVTIREAQCTIRVYRGIFEQSEYKPESIDVARTYWIPAVFVEPSGVVFQILNQSDSSGLAFRVPNSQRDNCTRDNCTSFSTLRLSSVTSPYSMFAELEPEQVPGISIAYQQLVGAISVANAVSEDTSPSNIAIIALPLIIALPPISLLDQVSGWATLWYWLVTDVLSAVPMIIKGIELIIVHRAKVDTLATFARHAGRFGVFETWYSMCEIPTAKAHSKTVTGWVLIAVALSFVFLATMIEIFYWTLKQRRKKRAMENDLPLLGLRENDDNMVSNINADTKKTKDRSA